MKLLVLGHLSVDVFHAPDGSEQETAGGLFRALQALSDASGKADRIIPVAGVNRKDGPAIRERLAAMPGVETDGLFAQDTPLHRVHYYFRSEEEYVECTKDLAPPIPFHKIKPHLDVNGILINMTSGVDLTLNTLDEIRMSVRGEDIPIHLDIHNLTLGVNERNERFRRPIAEWRRWAFMIGTVQMNQEEVAGLTLEALTEEQTVGHLLTLGVKGVVVTRGAHGVSIFENEHKKVSRTDLPGPETPAQGPPVGHGDVFGATFFLHYLKNRDLLAAATKAQAAAGATGVWT